MYDMYVWTHVNACKCSDTFSYIHAYTHIYYMCVWACRWWLISLFVHLVTCVKAMWCLPMDLQTQVVPSRWGPCGASMTGGMNTTIHGSCWLGTCYTWKFLVNLWLIIVFNWKTIYLVGICKHVLFSIVYGIILPIDEYLWLKPPTTIVYILTWILGWWTHWWDGIQLGNFNSLVNRFIFGFVSWTDVWHPMALLWGA